MLAAANAEVRCVNKDGMTALMLAAKAGQGEIVHVLLAAKADVQTKSKDGSTALMVAAASGNCEIASALIVAKCGGAVHQHGRHDSVDARLVCLPIVSHSFAETGPGGALRSLLATGKYSAPARSHL